MRPGLLREADDLARELDLLVFSLEQTPDDPSTDALVAERARLRRRLDALRQRMQDLADGLHE